MKIFITEKQLNSLVETTEIDSELGKENFKRYKFFLSLLNDEVKKEYPFIDEINVSNQRMSNFTDRFYYTPKDWIDSYVVYFEVWTKKNMNDIKGLDWNKFNNFIENKISSLLAAIFPKEFSQIVSEKRIQIHLTFFESNPMY
jgi:hypothetical protein